MESPPSSSTWSEAFILSDDSGLLITSGSISSGSMSAESRPLALSDGDDKSDSLDGMSDIMGGENFNTLKKGPNYTAVTIEPPPEFQDEPSETTLHILIADNICFLPLWLDKWATKVATNILKDSFQLFLYKLNTYTKQRKSVMHPGLTRAYWTSDWLPFSPCHGGRPSSRTSLGSSRLSSSHNSLSIPAAHKVDDSSFITQAVSHDTLSSHQISDLYNVPFDSDIYTVPIDNVRQHQQQPLRTKPRKRRRHTAAGCRDLKQSNNNYNYNLNKTTSRASCNVLRPQMMCSDGINRCGKRHSMPGTSTGLRTDGEPIHMTLQEVRQYLQNLYSSSSDSSETNKQTLMKAANINNNNKYSNTEDSINMVVVAKDVSAQKYNNKKNMFLINIKTKKVKDSSQHQQQHQNYKDKDKQDNKHNHQQQQETKIVKKMPPKNFSIKQTLCNIFRFRKFVSPNHLKIHRSYRQSVDLVDGEFTYNENSTGDKPLATRALPPLPAEDEADVETSKDFATSIQKVKDYGWYWGPLSSEAAEKILSNEPDGSFIVRDSSDDHYIFSLTFKLNDCVRHVRIEHDQGNFSFGSCTKFKSQTIVEFIENAVEHSRSGRYLFFLNRRPTTGPMRVQLLHPVSRFKQTQSLQHMCRFVILKLVRRDLIPSLPLPRRVIDYLSTPHYYSEHMFELDESEEATEAPVPVSDTRQS